MREEQALKVKTRGSSSGSVSVKYGFLKTFALLYLGIPVLIFFIGYLRAAWSIPCSLVIGGCLVYGVKLCVEDKRSFEIKISVLIAFAVVSALLVYYCDIGEMVWGTTDHAFRRATLRDLIDYKWPIVYDLSLQNNPAVNSMLPDETVGFSYYFAFWMVPAVFGKLFGFACGNIVLMIWSFIGITATLICMAGLSRGKAWPVIFSYVCFSGLDAIPYFYNEAHQKQYWMWLEGWVEHMYYISNFNQLLNVFHQCIPLFLIVAVLMLCNDNRMVGFFGCLAFAYSPWATLGLIPLCIYWLIGSDRSFKRIISPLNIVPPVLMLMVFVPFYTANPTATEVSGFTYSYCTSPAKFVLDYVVFLFFEVLPAALLLWRKFGTTALYRVSVISLIVIPLYMISPQNDFVMRASIPALFVLCMLLSSSLSDVDIRSIPSSWDKKSIVQKLKGAGTVVVLVLMAYVWFQMTVTILASTYDGSERHNEDIYSFGDIHDPEYLDLINEQFYVYDYEDSFFFTHMSREVQK